MSHETFETIEQQRMEYGRFDMRGTQWKVRLKPPPTSGTAEPNTHFIATTNELFYHLMDNVGDGDMVGITIHNEVNQIDILIACGFRKKYQISSDVIRSVFDKVSHSNTRFNAIDTLIVVVQADKMPVDFGGIKRKGRLLASKVQLKRSIV